MPEFTENRMHEQKFGGIAYELFSRTYEDGRIQYVSKVLPGQNLMESFSNQDYEEKFPNVISLFRKKPKNAPEGVQKITSLDDAANWP